MKLWLPFLLAVFVIAAAPVAESPAWKAGAASAKITPEQPMWMAGYAARTKPSEGVELDLFAKALVIEDQAGAKFALITMDLIGVPRNVRLAVAERVKKEHGIEPANLAINASHTHSGPELRTSKIHGADDVALREKEATEYTTKLEDTLVRLVGEAIQKSVPAHLDYSTARCGVSMNRRTPDGKGGWNNFPNPNGPVDQTVPVLKASSAEGKEIAIVFGYACHCTTLGHQKFSGDYAGYAQQEIENAHPGAVAMFANGCSGDQNPYPRRTMELAQQHGKSLATSVQAALETHMQRLSGPIRAAYREIPLAYDTLPTKEQLLEEQKSKNKWMATHATRVLQRIADEGPLPATYPYPVQVLRLGNELTWVTLGGEVVVDYSLRLKKDIKDPIVWVSGYTNDVMAYIPSLRIWQEGGYEGGGAMIYGTHPTRWSDKTEVHIMGTVMELRKAVE
ncbi:neutral/alkaline non-lysosomal ceramidase N-terminal domain-containing protein [Prosthecobacter sp.]|uniref:neutral/alkaline non-lysosomal ceramidase N-terminal domain-containing protein n=1 Tax=Prosthecobacter sp. TaxID=1965333 RepID=UPI001DFA3CF7|nr:neutral/alkaline non-lysosomal ceramidase N-terminal domain-containing protein [Prosthecobacter sp.]MCB1278358.1 neutral/alkaline non-lysosomal ceramidase N-terminal domain-containing protein [Prosthecobacter sp.]